MDYILVHGKPTGRATLINLDNVVWFGREEDGGANVRFLGDPHGFVMSETFDEIQDMIVVNIDGIHEMAQAVICRLEARQND